MDYSGDLKEKVMDSEFLLFGTMSTVLGSSFPCTVIQGSTRPKNAKSRISFFIIYQIEIIFSVQKYKKICIYQKKTVILHAFLEKTHKTG